MYNAERYIKPLFLFSPPFLISLLCKHATPTAHNPCSSCRPSLENTRFYDDSPESGRLKKSNTKP